MRHQKKINHLGRTSSHRKAMLANMASSLIIHKRISTTTAKAKALRIYVEPLLTKAKDDTTHSRRTVFSYLKSKEAVTELFREVAVKIGNRPGGYTRILKTGNRLGDNADMCIIELVDYNENMLAAKADSKAPAKRSRRGRKKAEGAEPEMGKKTPEISENSLKETKLPVEAPAKKKKKAGKDSEETQLKAEDQPVEAIVEETQVDDQTADGEDNPGEKKEE